MVYFNANYKYKISLTLLPFAQEEEIGRHCLVVAMVTAIFWCGVKKSRAKDIKDWYQGYGETFTKKAPRFMNIHTLKRLWIISWWLPEANYHSQIWLASKHLVEFLWWCIFQMKDISVEKFGVKEDFILTLDSYSTSSMDSPYPEKSQIWLTQINKPLPYR